MLPENLDRSGKSQPVEWYYVSGINDSVFKCLKLYPHIRQFSRPDRIRGHISQKSVIQNTKLIEVVEKETRLGRFTLCGSTRI
jgi:hypothetical protein